MPAHRAGTRAAGRPGAGPRVYRDAELLRGHLWASHKHRLTVPVRVPGQAARAVRAGANLATERAVGRRTWEEFLADQAGSSRESGSGR